ncbi:metal-dependent amidohydrolase [Hyaloraphidium curvatum]|nr:metal-dependent amidohydrolase [Hyaloraphidium curvatum]
MANILRLALVAALFGLPHTLSAPFPVGEVGTPCTASTTAQCWSGCCLGGTCAPFTSCFGVAQAPADRIFYGGPVVTVEDDGRTAEAVAVRNGTIVGVGWTGDILHPRFQGPNTEMVDLKGRTLVPGFIDGHSHFFSFGFQAIGANLLAAPDGPADTIDDIVRELTKFAQGPDVNLTGWIFGLGYDDSLLGRHPNRLDLDKVSTTVPVLAAHISLHFCAVNSVGLALIGYNASTKDPEGGTIQRFPNSTEPNGVLEELAAIPNMAKFLAPNTPQDALLFASRGQEMALRFGYTTVQEGRALGPQHVVLKGFADTGRLKIDCVSYIDYTEKKIIDAEFRGTEYRNRYRVGGLKITLDGSPQGRTAWRGEDRPYLVPPYGQNPGFSGNATITNETFILELLDEAYRKDWPTLVHANGEAAIDQYIHTMRPMVDKYGVKDRRNVLIHGQFITSEQVDEVADLGDSLLSLFPMHTFYWGDWYDTIVGPEKANTISPMRTALKRFSTITSHTDAPVALPNLMQIAWSTVNRISRSGAVKGEGERLTALEALKTFTIWGAYQHFEEARKGSIAEGKLADLVVLSHNPLTVDPLFLNKIQVMSTIKEGQTLYTHSDW